jgi:thiamine biosynthesis lipoprotein
MGTYVRIQIVLEDEHAARAAMDAAYAEIERLEAMLSEWRDDSEISSINRSAGGEAVSVSPETVALARRSVEIARETRGAFDPTFAACGRLWSFRDRVIPERASIEHCRSLVDWHRIEISENSVRLADPGMRLGVAGIGKGYILDRAADVLRAHGMSDFTVDGGGDLVVSGRGPDRPWTIGIAHPRRPGLYGSIEVPPGAVVTSGDYLQMFERDGRRYHHILDPRTGYPADRSVAVTVLAPDAATADALATGLFVLGPDVGLERVETMPGVEALFFDPDLEVRASSGFPEIRRAP